MSRRIHLGAIRIGVVLLALWACAGAGEPTTTGGQQDQPPDSDAPIVDWLDPSKVVTLDDGWTVHACEGDAPLLCVEKDGVPIGVVEALEFPLESMDWYDLEASVDENLRTLADEFAEVIGSDRAVGCGADYVFEPFPSQHFVLGNTPGIFYGFVGTMPDGSPSELNLQYATLVDDRLIAISAIAYDEGGCPGRDDLSSFTSADLAEFRSQLESVLHESPLPLVGEGGTST